MRRPLLLVLLLACFAVAGCGDKQAVSLHRAGYDAGLTEPASAWLEGLRSVDADVRHEALVALAAWYEDEPTGLFEQEAARDLLLPVVDDLARMAADADVACSRWNAVLLLGEMGYRALSATDALVAATRDADPELRKLAIEGLAQVASPRRGLLSGVHDILRKALPAEKQAVLQRWSPADPALAYGALYTTARGKALQTVAEHLTDDAPEVVRAAVHALGSWGPDAVQLTKVVLPFLRHESRDVRQNALYTVRAFKPPAELVLQPYIDFIRTTDRGDLRGRVMIAGAILGLGELGGDGIQALDFLHRIAKDARLRSDAEKAIRKIEADLSVVESAPPPLLPDPRPGERDPRER